MNAPETRTALPYRAAMEDVAFARLPAGSGPLIGGVHAPGGEERVAVDPASAETIAAIAESGAAAVDAALASSSAAATPWGRLDPAERAKLLFAFAAAIGSASRELAILATRESGIPIRWTRDRDALRAAHQAFSAAGWADKREYLRASAARPAGIVAAIIAGGSPLGVVDAIVPPLAGGNAVIVVPTRGGALCALRVAEIAIEAGLPAGVINVLPGGDATATALVQHTSGPDAFLVRGSTAVESVLRSAGIMRPIRREPATVLRQLVFADAPLDGAVEGIVTALSASGLNRVAGSHVIVQESIAASFADRLRDRFRQIRSGSPLDANTEIGPFRDAAHAAWFAERLAAAAADGAVTVMPARSGGAGSSAPAIVRGWGSRAAIARHDWGGPVAALETFRTPDEAIERAGADPDGPAAIWTTNAGAALALATSLRASAVWCNAVDPLYSAAAWVGRPGGRDNSGCSRTPFFC